MSLNDNFILFLKSSMGRNIYRDIPSLEEYWDYICHLFNGKYYDI